MKPIQRTVVAQAAAAFCGLCTLCALAGPGLSRAQNEPTAEPPAQAPACACTAVGFAVQRAGSHRLNLIFTQVLTAAEGQWTVWVGAEDVTVNFRRQDAHTLVGDFTSAQLAPGRQTLKVMVQEPDGAWRSMGQAPIQSASGVQPEAPATASAPKPAAPKAFKPSLVLGAKTQPWESHSAAAAASSRSRYADATLQAGLETEHSGEAWSVKTTTNLVGSSYQNEALQFGVLGAHAPQVDLARFLVQGQIRSAERGPTQQRTSLALGHVQAGTNPLLANSVANRGVVLRHQVGERLDLAFSSQSSTALVGARRLTGLDDADNRFDQVTLAYEALERAGGLRLELGVFGGRTLTPPALGSLGSSTPAADERSKGLGLRMVSATEDNRWRAEAVLAQSQLATAATGNSPSPRRSAYSLEVAHDFYQGEVTWPNQPDWPLSLSANLRTERTAPEYRSLGAATAADVQIHKLALTGSLGVLNGELALNSQRDNLGADVTQLRRSTPAFTTTWRLPLAALVKPSAAGASAAPANTDGASSPSGDGEANAETTGTVPGADPSTAPAVSRPAREQSEGTAGTEGAEKPLLWPELSYALELHREWADPAFLPSGTNPNDLANSLTSTHRIGLNWAWPSGTFGYAYSRTLQDKRQAAYALDDQLDSGHDFTATWNANPKLVWNSALGWHQGTVGLTGAQTRTLTGSLGLQWTPLEKLVLTTAANAGDTRDTPRSALVRLLGGSLGLSRSWTLQGGGIPMTAQWALRYAFTRNSTVTTSSPPAGAVRNEAVTATASLAF